MKPNEYLNEVLAAQTFLRDDDELVELRERRNDIDTLLRAHFSGDNPSIRWAGSMAKGTMIRESYDGDITCYFPHDENGVGDTLEDIYTNVSEALQDEYQVEQKASALRVRDKVDWQSDLHIDVVPGRFTSDEKTDVFLHRTTHEKDRLKTNLQVHIDHIKDSGVIDAIRLTKLWKVRNGLESAKTFVLELLVVKLLKTQKSADLATQFESVMTEFRDNADTLSVSDPANSGNDLKPLLDACRGQLSAVADGTLWQIENKGWEAVFGEVVKEDTDDSARIGALQDAAVQVSNPNRPWYPGK